MSLAFFYAERSPALMTLLTQDGLEQGFSISGPLPNASQKEVLQWATELFEKLAAWFK